MHYPATIYSNFIFLFLGAALGSFACIIVGKVYKRKYFQFRLSLSFLFLAAFVAFAAILVVKTGIDKRSLKIIFASFYRRGTILAGYAVLGGLCAAFLRTFFPIFAAAYITFTFCFAVALYKQMPVPQNIKLTVSESFIREEYSGEEYNFSAAKAFKSKKKSGSEDETLCSILFCIYELDENAILPLPHIWYEMCGALPGPVEVSEILVNQEMMPKLSEAMAIFENVSFENKFKKKLYKIYKKILGEPRMEVVKVPVQRVYPSLYNLKIEPKNSNFNAILERIM